MKRVVHGQVTALRSELETLRKDFDVTRKERDKVRADSCSYATKHH